MAVTRDGTPHKLPALKQKPTEILFTDTYNLQYDTIVRVCVCVCNNALLSRTLALVSVHFSNYSQIHIPAHVSIRHIDPSPAA